MVHKMTINTPQNNLIHNNIAKIAEVTIMDHLVDS